MWYITLYYTVQYYWWKNFLNRTKSVEHTITLAAMRTWLAQGAEYLIFLRTVKNRAVFHEFYARFFMNTRFILWSARIFGRNRARVSLHSRPRPQRTIWIKRSNWSISEFLACDFLKTSYGVYGVFDTLFPSLLFTLDRTYRTKKTCISGKDRQLLLREYVKSDPVRKFNVGYT